MTGTKARRAFVPLVALAAVLGGCGGGAGENANAPDQGTGVGIESFVARPVPGEVSPSASLTADCDLAEAVPDGFDSSDLNQDVPFTFSAGGTQDYLGDIHQYMRGRILLR